MLLGHILCFLTVLSVFILVFYHVRSILSEVCCATLSSSTFRLWLCLSSVFKCWSSLSQTGSPLRIRQPGGWRCAARGDGHLRVCCQWSLASSFCWRSSRQHWCSHASCCRRVVHWAAISWPLLTQSSRDAWGGRLQLESSLCIWFVTPWMLVVSFLGGGEDGTEDNRWLQSTTTWKVA